MKEQFVHSISCFTIVKWPLQPLLDKKGVSYSNVSDMVFESYPLQYNIMLKEIGILDC